MKLKKTRTVEATVSANPLLGSEEHNERNPYLKNTVVNKTNHMIEDESILEKAIGTEIEWFPIECLDQKVLKLSLRRDPKHGMAFPKSSFTKGKWSTTMISGEAVATNDLEMDEVQ
uniref:Uncharacterized protein n=2 Tax=Brassica oleracea TaxID=3712 RepID=A0A0D3DM14_BRAOL